MSKIRKYRIVIKNVSPTDEVVSDTIESELGDVEIVNWWIDDQVNYKGLVAGGGMMSQRDSHVIVEYKERN